MRLPRFCGNFPRPFQRGRKRKARIVDPVRPPGPVPKKELRIVDTSYAIPSERFARCIASSKRVRWDIETDVIRGRRFDRANKFLPDGLTLAGRLDFFSPKERIYFSQVQGRTYANMFGLVERFISAKVSELSHDHWLGDQVALEALVRFP